MEYWGYGCCWLVLELVASVVIGVLAGEFFGRLYELDRKQKRQMAIGLAVVSFAVRAVIGVLIPFMSYGVLTLAGQEDMTDMAFGALCLLSELVSSAAIGLLAGGLFGLRYGLNMKQKRQMIILLAVLLTPVRVVVYALLIAVYMGLLVLTGLADWR